VFGIKIGDLTMYSAAHCFWKSPVSPSVGGWWCADGSFVTQYKGCGNSPRWRFGVSGTSGASAWTANECFDVFLTSAFTSLNDPGSDVSKKWQYAALDYAAVDLTNCAVSGVSWLGTRVASDFELGGILYLWGYPVRAPCPNGTTGTKGNRSSSGGILNTDCPGTGTTWPGTTWQLSGGTADGSPPFSGARLWGGNLSGSGPGTGNAADTIRIVVDATAGQSGSPVYVKPDANTRQVVGVVSQNGSGLNLGNRWTATVFNWFSSKTHFPTDT
jgi:hypothetical protein